MSSFSEYSIYNSKLEELNILEEFIFKNNKNINDKYNTNTFLLDTSLEDFSLIEKYVYEIAMFQFKNLNIKYNSDKYYIEFWWRNDIFKSFHIDCDEKYRTETKKYSLPLLSNVFYLSDSYYATILTNIELEDYKYKEFNNHNISISLSKKGKIVSFDSRYFHGVSNIFEDIDPGVTTSGRSTIMINLWDKKPKDIIYYNSNETIRYDKVSIIQIMKEPEPEYIDYDTNYELLFENLLYENYYCVLYNFGKELYKKYNDIRSIIKKSTFIFSDKKISLDKQQIKPILTSEHIIEPFLIKHIYTTDICLWILFEMKSQCNIEINMDMVIFNFILISLNNSILPKLSIKYPILKIVNITSIVFTSKIEFEGLSSEIYSNKITTNTTNSEGDYFCIFIALEELTIYYINTIYVLNVGDIFIITENMRKNTKIDDKQFLLIKLDYSINE
jgi:hypothetical protein